MGTRLYAEFFAPMVAGLAVISWAALFWLHRVSAGHHAHGHGSASLLFFGGQAIGSLLEWVILFLAGWLLMTAAMMFPTTLPLVRLFRRLISGRTRQGSMLTLLLAGYISVWLAFGLVVSVLGVAASRWMPWLISAEAGRSLGPFLFLVAGVFQFVPLKRHCLDMCHSPLDMHFGHWEESRPMRGSFLLGIRHGFACVGCCWALMLLMFAGGSSHLIWMLALTLAIVAEKNLPFGRRMVMPLGALLLSGAVISLISRF